MKFPYSSVISAAPGSDELLLWRRPEIPVTITAAAGELTLIGLVDTGSDNTIFPKAVADLLGISVEAATGPAASAFGGHRVQLLVGEVVLRLEADGESLSWKATVCFYDFPASDEESVILGHAGFLDYFTATFDGKVGILTLIANDELPPLA